ncbi:pentapeptide repeat-containing protein [Amycolatopsis sp. MEPSY49]|uniref:pentapeptide repeat-containing protein n=1 Tax=Amycolatopsis sp. MEPSY49 TaxID=3151600 RepID=UPI003EF5ECF9
MTEPTNSAQPDSVASLAPATKPQLRPIPRWVVAVGIPAMCLVAAVVAWRLLSSSVTPTQLDALRTAGTLGVGTGGAFALWLAVRRQRSTELDLLQKYEAHQLAERVAAQNAAAADRAATHAEHDARERRLTDLYLKAVEQLGSEKAAVRHGALYALERVAQDNVGQRQTVVDVICAYLRAPYPVTPVEQPTQRRGVHRSLLRTSTVRDTVTTTARPGVSLSIDAQQEKEVRLTAQKIVFGHLWPGDPEDADPLFWSDIDLDLAGATLFDIELDDVVIRKAIFTAATFVGAARFDGALFTGRTSFDGAIFTARTGFVGTKFDSYSSFSRSRFRADTKFNAARFFEPTNFSSSEFSSVTQFNRAYFLGEASFGAAKFTGYTVFSNAEFRDDAWFAEANFGSRAVFDGVTFTKFTSFADATLTAATFQRATFANTTEFIRTHFIGETDFDKVQFEDSRLVDFRDARFDTAPPEALHEHLAG